MAYLFRTYNRFIESNPFIGNCVTSGVCYGAGDALAQTIEKKMGKREKYDFARMATYGAFGLCFGGPAYYLWFKKIHHMDAIIKNFMIHRENKYVANQIQRVYTMKLKKIRFSNTNSSTGSCVKQYVEKNGRFLNPEEEQMIKKLVDVNDPIVKSKTTMGMQILADQFVFSALYPFYFIMLSGLMMTGVNLTRDKELKEKQGYQKLEHVVNKFRDGIKSNGENSIKKWPIIYSTDLMVWPVLQIINFTFVPPHLNSIYVNVINVFWNAFLCSVGGEH
jgi:hypothetical protein